MQQASELKNVQKKLGCERAALGSLSEAATVFDPERLVEIIQELNGQLTPTHGGKDPRLAHLPGTLTLVDATLIIAIPRIMTASVMKQSGGSGLGPMSFQTKWCCSAHPAKRPIAPWTGRKPTKRNHEMVCFHMMGWATTEEIEAHLAKLKLADAKPAKKV